MRSKYPPQLSEINLPGNLFSYLGHFRESWIGALSSRDLYRIEVLNGTILCWNLMKIYELLCFLCYFGAFFWRFLIHFDIYLFCMLHFQANLLEVYQEKCQKYLKKTRLLYSSERYWLLFKLICKKSLSAWDLRHFKAKIRIIFHEVSFEHTRDTSLFFTSILENYKTKGLETTSKILINITKNHNFWQKLQIFSKFLIFYWFLWSLV